MTEEDKTVREQAADIRASFLKAQDEARIRKQQMRAAADIEEASRFLGSLVGRLALDIKDKARRKDVEMRTDREGKETPTVVFRNDILTQVPPAALYKSAGFAKLNDAARAANVCLGEPHDAANPRTTCQPIDEVRIYFELPYAASDYAFTGMPYPADDAEYAAKVSGVQTEAKVEEAAHANDDAKAEKSAGKGGLFGRLLRRKPQ